MRDTTGVPDVFWYEHFRKWDKGRQINLRKLKDVEGSLVQLPGIGEMFRAEAERLKPAVQVFGVKKFVLNPKVAKAMWPSVLDERTKSTSSEKTAEVEKKIDGMIAIWRDFKKLPALKDASSAELPLRLSELSIGIRDDPDDIRGFYQNHRVPSWPDAVIINEDWALFRWIQVHLLAGLDYFGRYGVATEPGREKLTHELLDLEYLISALLVGGLASREKRMVERFKFLRCDGVLLR